MTLENIPSELSASEKEQLKEISSCLHGFVDFNGGTERNRRALIGKAIACYERELILRQQQQTSQGTETSSSIFCTLGHLHLLLQDYPNALSAYQKYYNSDEQSWSNAPYLYGLGCVYFYFGMYQWAIQSFQQTLYLNSAFPVANEIHFKLGVIFKTNQQFEYSLKHLRLALNDNSQATYSKCEVRFHIAHLYEVKGDPLQAKELYDQLLGSEQINHTVKANTLRQLGWLYHTVESLGEKSMRLTTAIHYLQNSLDADPTSGQTWYFLGRSFSSLGKVHEAFMSYRNSIDKSDASADTWCSIGILYQQQTQPMDALQAYICAVQLDRHHSSAWTNLGLLYENCKQFSDALSCYRRATEEANSTASGGSSPDDEERQDGEQTGSDVAGRTSGVQTNLVARILILEQKLSKTSPQALQEAKIGHQALPPIEEAFNLPIPAELTSRQQSTSSTPGGGNSGAGNQPTPQTPPTPCLSINHGPTSGTSSNGPFRYPAGRSRLNSHTQPQDNGVITEGRQRSGSQSSSVHQHSSSLGHAHLQSPGGPNDSVSMRRGRGASPAPLLIQPTLDTDVDMDSSLLSPTGTRMDMTASQIVDSVKILPDLKSPPGSFSLLSEVCRPPRPPNPPCPPLPVDQLLPAVPTFNVEARKDIAGPQLYDFCRSHPITLIRGLTAALRVDLSLFSTRTLLTSFPDHQVEVRSQRQQDPDKNVDSAGHPVWKCNSSRSFTTVSKYAAYQAASFQERKREETEKGVVENKSGPNGRPGGAPSTSTAEQSNSTGPSQPAVPAARTGGKKKPRMIKFGTNVDLSDETKFKEQLAELSKLPQFLKVFSPGNMLSHLGHTVLGMNSVQLYMKVPGSRTPGHQENNNFCSVNINIGPGDCEWFGVPDEYWGVIHTLCEKHNVDYLSGSWWPLLEDLEAERVPVTRFTQKPGEVVWVNGGCVHWVQAKGWCNNIAWNTGPLCDKIFKLAVERYEWNKLRSYKSIVPIIHLSWTLARDVKIANPHLFKQIKFVLMRTLKHTERVLLFLNLRGQSIQYHGFQDSEPTHYCFSCEVEVFNLLFVRRQEQNGTYVVHCLDCALNMSPTLESFTVLNQFSKEDLMETYNVFQWQKPKPGFPAVSTNSVPQALPSAGSTPA